MLLGVSHNGAGILWPSFTRKGTERCAVSLAQLPAEQVWRHVRPGTRKWQKQVGEVGLLPCDPLLHYSRQECLLILFTPGQIMVCAMEVT